MGGGDTDNGETQDLARLREENALLRAELEQAQPGAQRRGRLRALAVGVLVALAAVAFVGAEVGVWARRSVFNTEVFSARAIAIGADPAVQDALATYLTDQIMLVADPKALFEDVLPGKGRILAAPLTSAVRTFVHDRVRAFVSSERFTELWAEAVTRGQEAMVRVVRDEGTLVSASGDKIIIDLTPVINAALARIGEVSPELFGRTIDFPTLTADDLPGVARAKLAGALGRDLPAELGIVEIQGGGGALAATQRAVRLFDLLLWLLIGLAVVLPVLALWLSAHRRRTLLQLTVALALGTVLVRRLLIAVQTEALALVRVDETRAAASAITHAFVDPLLDATDTILLVLAAVAVLAILTGPYRWAAWLRDLVRRLFRGGAAVVSDVATSPGSARAADWAGDHLGVLQGVGVGLAVLALLLVDLSWTGVLIVALMLAAFLGALWWISASRRQAAGA